MIMRKILIPLLALALVPAACTTKNADKSAGKVEGLDSLPKEVRGVVTSVAAGDSVKFSQTVIYPLTRPYPLHDILSASELQKYYSVLVDDSLRKVVTTPAEWSDFGWRGWSPSEGQYIWVSEEGVYSIPYLSAREKTMRDKLVREELASLAPSLRKGWTPLGCYTEAGGRRIYRVDMSDGADTGVRLRLCAYGDHSGMRGEPEQQLFGVREVEGSALNVSYVFSGEDDSQTIIYPESSDGSQPAIEVEGADGTAMSAELRAAYWLDLLPKK